MARLLSPCRSEEAVDGKHRFNKKPTTKVERRVVDKGWDICSNKGCFMWRNTPVYMKVKKQRAKSKATA